MSHIMHKEKIKKEIRELLNKQKQNKIITDQQINDHLDTILYHVYRFVVLKMERQGLHPEEPIKQSQLSENRNQQSE